MDPLGMVLVSMIFCLYSCVWVPMQLLMNIYFYRIETALLDKFQEDHTFYWNIEVTNGDITDIYVEDSSHFPRPLFNFVAGKCRNGCVPSIENTDMTHDITIP